MLSIKLKKFLFNFYTGNSTQISAYIIGIVITQSVCEIIAILAPVFGLQPNASGKTTVFKPSGVAYIKNIK